jgi:hypothetical protein
LGGPPDFDAAFDDDDDDDDRGDDEFSARNCSPLVLVNDCQPLRLVSSA